MEIGYFKKLPTRRPVVTFEVRPPGERQDLLIANCRRVLEDAWAGVGRKS